MPRENRVLSQAEVRELADLTWRVLDRDGRESSYVDDDNRLVAATVARLDSLALDKGDRRIECHLILENDVAGLRLQRLCFAFAAGGFDSSESWRLETGDPYDIWHDSAAAELREHLDRQAGTAD